MRPGLQIWTESDGPLRDAAPQVPGMEPTCPMLRIRPWVDLRGEQCFGRRACNLEALRHGSTVAESQIRCGSSGRYFC